MVNNNDLRSLLSNLRLSADLSNSFFDALWYAYFIDQRSADIIKDYNALRDGVLRIILRKTSENTCYNLTFMAVKDDDLVAVYTINLGINSDVKKIFKTHNVSLAVYDRIKHYEIHFSAVAREIEINAFSQNDTIYNVEKNQFLDYNCKIYIFIHYTDIFENKILDKDFINLENNFVCKDSNDLYNYLSKYKIYCEHLDLKIKEFSINNSSLNNRLYIALPSIAPGLGNLLTGGAYFLYYLSIFWSASSHSFLAEYNVRNYYNRIIDDYVSEYDFIQLNTFQALKQRSPNVLNFPNESYIANRIRNKKVKNIFRGIAYFDVNVLINNETYKMFEFEIMSAPRWNDQNKIIYLSKIKSIQTTYTNVLCPQKFSFLNNNIDFISIKYFSRNNGNVEMQYIHEEASKQLYYNEILPALILTGASPINVD